jgi:hypothetical protein
MGPINTNSNFIYKKWNVKEELFIPALPSQNNNVKRYEGTVRTKSYYHVITLDGNLLFCETVARHIYFHEKNKGTKN